MCILWCQERPSRSIRVRVIVTATVTVVSRVSVRNRDHDFSVVTGIDEDSSCDGLGLTQNGYALNFTIFTTMCGTKPPFRPLTVRL